MPTKNNQNFEIYSAETGTKIERIVVGGLDVDSLVENSVEYLLNNGIKAAIRFSVTLKGKELYDMCRVFDGKEPLKKGNNRWRTIKKLERRT